MRQVRTYFSTLAEEGMTHGADFSEEFMPADGIARPRIKVVIKPPHLGKFLLGSAGGYFAPMFADQVVEHFVLVQRDHPKLFDGEVARRQDACVNFLENCVRPRFAAQQELADAGTNTLAQAGIMIEQSRRKVWKIECRQRVK